MRTSALSDEISRDEVLAVAEKLRKGEKLDDRARLVAIGVLLTPARSAPVEQSRQTVLSVAKAVARAQTPEEVAAATRRLISAFGKIRAIRRQLECRSGPKHPARRHATRPPRRKHRRGIPRSRRGPPDRSSEPPPAEDDEVAS